MAQPTVRNEGHTKSGHHRMVFGLGVLFIGTLIHTVATITRGWIYIPEKQLSYGIFSMEANDNGALMSVRVFTILGIILGMVSLVLTGVYLKVTRFLTRSKVSTLILVTGIGAGGSSLIGALIFALEFYFLISVTDKNYSFALCIAGGVLLIAGSVMVFLGARQHMRGSHFSRNRITMPGQVAMDPSAHHIPYPDQGHSGDQVWHTQFYSEPPPAYNLLELSELHPPKQELPQVLFDTLPPSYSDAVKWYPKT